MKAVKVVQASELAVKEVEVPQLRPGFCLVRVKAVALNPSDFTHLHYIECTGCTLGCDYAGIVEEVGADSKLKKGDRVAGLVHGGNTTHPEDGAFSEYVLVREGLQFFIPESLSMEKAATLGVAITTVGLALCHTLELPLPTEMCLPGTPVLIYGGSTATGTVAIQIAKMSGLDVITTCSPTNFALVKSLGASAAFDYSEPDCAEAINKYTKGRLHHALDCISKEASALICSKALSNDTSSQSLRYCSLLPVQFPREDVIATTILGYTAFGEAFHKIIDIPGKPEVFNIDLPAKPEDYNFTSKFFSIAQKFLNEQKLLAHPIEVREGGLEGIPEGLEDLKAGRVRARKLVYQIA